MNTNRIWTKGPVLLASGVVLVLFGTHIFANSNVLGPSDLCQEAVDAESFREAFPDSGRASSEEASVTTEAVGLHCTVQSSGLLLATKNRLGLDLYGEGSGFPFSSSRWPNAGEMSYGLGDAPWAVSEEAGWIMIPAKCWKNFASEAAGADAQSFVIQASVTEGSADRLGLARILTDAAKQEMERVNCGGAEVERPQESLSVPSKTNASLGRQCNVKGFSLPGSIASRNASSGKVHRVSGKMGSVWVCDVWLKDSSTPQLSFSVAQNHTLVASLSNDIDTSVSTGPEWRAHGSPQGAIVATCKDELTHFGVHASSGFRSMMESQGMTGKQIVNAKQEAFEEFVNHMGSSLGCREVILE